ncbi:hypothetical protein Bca101_004755 [Brassica carinata]
MRPAARRTDKISMRDQFTLSGFDVTRSNNNFRLSDAPVSVRFGESTRFTRVTDSDKFIPTEMFRFRSYDQLLALANTNRQLPDILGELTAIQSTISDGLHGSQRVMLTLRVERGLSVCVSLFDGLAYAFHVKMTSYGAEPKVVLVTSRLFLNGTSATHVYFDTETNAASTQYANLFGDGLNQTGTSSKLLHAQKIEPITVSEVNHAVASLRYRVELSVADQTDDAVFVAFDMEMVKLTNIQASEAAQILGVGVDARVEDELPQFVADIVGKTFTFQLKLGEFNFTSKHQTFTISRIFTERQRAPLPAFVGDGDDHGPDDVIPVQNPVAPEVSPDTSTTVIEQAGGVAAVTGENPNANYQSSSSAVPGGPLGSSKQIADPNENGKKKARLE